MRGTGAIQQLPAADLRNRGSRRRATTSDRPPRPTIAEHVVKIEELAWAGGPDDDDNWCGEACWRISQYLSAQGIEHEAVSEPDDDEGYWGPHHWLELPDGTLIDPTITQFFGFGPLREARPDPYMNGAPLSTEKTAVLPPEHPFTQYYDRRNSPYLGDPD